MENRCWPHRAPINIHSPLLVCSQHALLRLRRQWKRWVVVFCRGYPLVNGTCLSATLLLVNCPDYYCDNVAIKKEALHQNGRGGLMVREMDVCRLQGSGKCIKVAIHSDTPPPPPTVLRQSCRLLTPVLIDIHSQSILLRCRKNRSKSTQDARDRTCGRENQKAVPNERP